MPLTRTHNLDITNSDIKREVLWSAHDNDETKIEIGIADAGAIYAMLSDLSAKKGAYVLREAFSNAYDATVATGDMSRPIEITIPYEHEADTLASKIYGANALVDMVTITDHGIGMDYDTIAEYFLQYGGSNKRDQIDAIGSKGLGSKAPLAIADTFTVISTKDGITTTAIIERKPGAAGTARCTTKQTGAESGTTISIPVQDPNVIQQMHEFADALKQTNIDATLIINGERIEAQLPTTIGEYKNDYVYVGEIELESVDDTCRVRLWEPLTHDNKQYRSSFASNQFPLMTNVSLSQVDIILGGVRYQLPKTDTRYRGGNIALAAVDPGWLNFTPSRDDIKDDEAASEFSNKLQTAWMNLDYTEVLKKYLTNNPDREVLRFIGQCEHKRDNTTYGYYNRPYTSRSFWVTVSSDTVEIARNDSRYSRTFGTSPSVTFTTEDLAEIRDWLPDYFEEFHKGGVHILKSSAKDSNGTIFTLRFDNDDIKKSKVSVLTDRILQHKVKNNHLADVLSTATKTSTIFLTGIDDVEKLKLVCRRENIYRAYRARMDAEPLDKTVNFIIVNESSELDSMAQQVLKDAKVKTVPYAEFLENTKAESKHRRQKTVNLKKMRQEQALVDIPEIKSVSGYYLKIPDHTETTRENVLFAITDNELRMNNGDEFRLSPRSCYGYEIADNDNEDAPFAHVAVAITPRSEDIPRMVKAWTLLIMLSRMAGTNIVPDYITHVYVTSGKCLKKSSDLLIEGGATVLDDQRTIASRVTDTIAAKRHIDEINNRLYVQAHDIFGDDNETALRFKALQNVNQSWTHPMNTVVTVYDVIKPYATDKVIETVIKPLAPIMDHRKLVKRKFFNDLSPMMWTTSDDRGLDLARSYININDDPVGYHDYKRAYELCQDVIKPYTTVFGRDLSLRMPDDVDIKKISHALGPDFVYNIEKQI